MAFRILSFCGGGIRGLMSATILARLNQEFSAKYNKPLIDQVDMIAGTSTGSLITALLLVGLTPEEISEFYLGLVPFYKMGQTDASKPMFPPDWLLPVLDELHLDPPISKFDKKALFTSFDIGAEGVPWSPQLFHNFPGSPTGMIGLLDAMSGSGAMPGMCAPYACTLGGRRLRLVDGAFVHHDPTVPAIAVAAANGIDVADISAIDIGTGFMRNFISANASEWGASQFLQGTDVSSGTLPPLLVNTPSMPQMPILNLCLNGTSTNLMPDLAGMLLGDRYAYLNPDFGARYVPENSTSTDDLEFLIGEGLICPLDEAMEVVDKYWAD